MMNPMNDGLAEHEKVFGELEGLLRGLLSGTGVRFAMLVDRKGMVLSYCEAKEAPRPANLENIATLVASNASATAHLAELLGEGTFSEQLHQGQKGTLYVESAGDQALLTLIFDSSVRSGRVRNATKRTVPQIKDVFDRLKSLGTVRLGETFGQDASALLDDLLG